MPGALSTQLDIVDRAGLVALLDRIHWSQGCMMPALLEVKPTFIEQPDPNCWTVFAAVRVKDRDTGEPVTVHAGFMLTLPESSMSVFRMLVGTLKTLWVHELQESLLLDNVRVLDPHKER